MSKIEENIKIPKIPRKVSRIEDNIKFQPFKANEIDWDKRRYETAKEILAAMVSTLPNPYASQLTLEELAKQAIRLADAFVAELKKEGKNERD